jgi:hypothetical protein
VNILNTYGVECPLCHAQPDSRCLFKNGKHRPTAHRERIEAAEELAETSASERGTGGREGER